MKKTVGNVASNILSKYLKKTIQYLIFCDQSYFFKNTNKRTKLEEEGKTGSQNLTKIGSFHKNWTTTLPNIF